MSNADLLEYKRYLQKYVFAGWEAPDDLKEWVRLLERHVMHSDLMDEGTQLPEGFQHSSNAADAEPSHEGMCLYRLHSRQYCCGAGSGKRSYYGGRTHLSFLE